MKWAWTICMVFGIRIRLHVTFLLLVAWVMAEAYLGAGPAGAWWGLLFVCCTFACVAIHELGHSVVAKKLGVQVGSITLLPIGGVAALRSIPEKPSHEIAITIAGPLMNVIIFGVLYVIGYYAPFMVPYYPGLMQFLGLPLGIGELIGALLVINQWMVLFNLIPAYPMDGGRLLRAALAGVLPYPRATSIAARVGRAIAVLFVLASVFWPGHFILGVIGVLIFLAAGSEEQTVRMRSVLRGVPVDNVMNPVFSHVTPNDTAGECLRLMYRTAQEDFPVLADGQLVGLMTRDGVVQGMRQDGGEGRIGDLMLTRFLTVPPDALLEQVYEQMLATGQKTVPVVQDGRLLGLLAQENVHRFFMVRDALARSGRRK
jgi:stage IV sporulation protein FB